VITKETPERSRRRTLSGVEGELVIEDFIVGQSVPAGDPIHNASATPDEASTECLLLFSIEHAS